MMRDARAPVMPHQHEAGEPIGRRVGRVTESVDRLAEHLGRAGVVARSPFELIEGNHRVRTARKETVVAFSKHIETQAQRAADPPADGRQPVHQGHSRRDE